jgi:hypothetical protein
MFYFQATHYLICKEIRGKYLSEGKSLELIWMFGGHKSREPGVTGNKFCAAESNICGSWVWKFLLVVILHLEFWSGLQIWNIYIYIYIRIYICIYRHTPYKGIFKLYLPTLWVLLIPISSLIATISLRYLARQHIVCTCIKSTLFDKIANIYNAWISGALKSALTTVVFRENSSLNCCVFPDTTLFIPIGIV